MLKTRSVTWIVLGALVVSYLSCVELTGQRITWFHDAANDVLHILIHYDGIHDARTNSTPGAEQIPKFVKNGDVMFMDWPFHFDMKKARANLESPDPVTKETARLFTSLETRPLGYYREPDGRVGGAQLVTLSGVKAFVKGINALISRAVQQPDFAKGEDLDRTVERMRAAAREDFQWIEVRGHAIRFTLPVHPGEWSRKKRTSLEKTLREIIHEFKMKRGDAENKLLNLIGNLTSAPMSYIDEGDRVTFVLGREDRPVTWRIRLRDEYEPSLEPVVVEAVKVDLDRALADAILDEGAKPTLLHSTVLAWGPPEERVRALLSAARSGDEARRKAAFEHLKAWAAEWNKKNGVPEAPEKTDDLAAWTQWYEAMKPFPSSGKQEPAPKTKKAKRL